MDREPLLRMYRQGFAAGQEAERRRSTGPDGPCVHDLLHTVIGLLASAMDSDTERETDV